MRDKYIRFFSFLRKLGKQRARPRTHCEPTRKKGTAKNRPIRAVLDTTFHFDYNEFGLEQNIPAGGGGAVLPGKPGYGMKAYGKRRMIDYAENKSRPPR